MIETLKNEIVEVTFVKKNGDRRVMLCTLIEDIIPSVTGTSVQNPDVTVVYDIEADGWRSFRNDSIIDWKVVTEKLENE